MRRRIAARTLTVSADRRCFQYESPSPVRRFPHSDPYAREIRLLADGLRESAPRDSFTQFPTFTTRNSEWMNSATPAQARSCCLSV